MYRDQDMNTHAFSIFHGRPIMFTCSAPSLGILYFCMIVSQMARSKPASCFVWQNRTNSNEGNSCDRQAFQNMSISKHEIVACWHFSSRMSCQKPGRRYFSKSEYFKKKKNKIVPCGDICHVWLDRSPIFCFF